MVQYTGEKVHWLKIDVGSKELLMTVSQRRGPKDRCAAAAAAAAVVVVARAAAACTSVIEVGWKTLIMVQRRGVHALHVFISSF